MSTRLCRQKVYTTNDLVPDDVFYKRWYKKVKPLLKDLIFIGVNLMQCKKNKSQRDKRVLAMVDNFTQKEAPCQKKRST